MNTKTIIWTVAISMLSCIVLDFVLPLKPNDDNTKLTRI